MLILQYLMCVIGFEIRMEANQRNLFMEFGERESVSVRERKRVYVLEREREREN